MLGLAQLLFIDKTKKNPWEPSSRCHFPFLETLLSEKKLNYTDFALAEHLTNNLSQPNENVAALICHLSLAARAGHLCVKIEHNSIVPDPETVWGDSTEDSQAAPSASELEFLRAMIKKGAQEFPQGIQEVSREVPLAKLPICKFANLYYLHRYWQQETAFFFAFSKILKSQPDIQIDLTQVEKKLEQTRSLLYEQMQAIKQACRNNFTIITGGPGTGKTHTAGVFLKLFWECLSPEQQATCQIAIAAPTGKAAANLEFSLRRSVQNLSDFPKIPAQTLHSLLGIRSSKFKWEKECPRLPFDVLIIDESSMIDVRMMSRLMEALKPGARLILLGDKHQLPPIEAGALFHDLVGLLKTSRQVIELTVCMRAELQTIVNLAQQINEGNSKEVLALVGSSSVKHVDVTKENEKLVRQQLIEYALSQLPDPHLTYSDPQELLQVYHQFRLLAPMREGFFGVDTLNRLFLEASMKKVSSGPFTLPIMIVKNDYKNELFNGEVGLLVKHSRLEQHCQPGDYAIFHAKDGKESVRKIPALLLPKYEYAYCLSVYKSQGSEFNHVVLVLPYDGHLLTRELLYTAVTRARQKLEIWGPKNTLQQMTENKSQRLSGVN